MASDFLKCVNVSLAILISFFGPNNLNLTILPAILSMILIPYLLTCIPIVLTIPNMIIMTILKQ